MTYEVHSGNLVGPARSTLGLVNESASAFTEHCAGEWCGGVTRLRARTRRGKLPWPCLVDVAEVPVKTCWPTASSSKAARPPPHRAAGRMLRSNVVTLSSPALRLRRPAMSAPPLFTATAMAACTCVYLLGLAGLAPRAGAVCLLPSAVVAHLQLYRVVLAPWFHSGFVHLAFNAVALYFLGAEFERAVGSTAAAYATLVVLAPVGGALHVAAAYFTDALAGTTLRGNCAVGISGVLFALIVVQLKHAETVSFFGLFTLPARVYPFFLLVVLSLLSPGLSFLGHLSGIAVGYALTHAVFTRIIPSDAAFDAFDDRLNLKSLPLHVANPDAATSAWLAAAPGLPTSTAPQQQSPLTAAADVMRSWIAGLSGGGAGRGSSGGSSAFSGQGHTLGAATAGVRSGSGTAGSRLLASADSATSERSAAASTASGGASCGGADASTDAGSKAGSSAPGEATHD